MRIAKKTEEQEKVIRERAALIQRAKAGDEDAAQELAERYKITKVYSQEEIDSRA